MELRKDPLTRSWILVGDLESGPAQPAECPYCPRPGEAGPPPIFSMPAGDPGSAHWGTRVFAHPDPLYRIEGDAQRAGVGMYDRMRTVGAHEIIIENPDHNRPLWVASDEEVERVMLTWARRIEDLKRDPRFRYICVFKNYGAEAGEEIAHTYSELTATTFIPRRLVYELRACSDYYQMKERCVFCDILRQEERQETRLIEQTPNFLALCPFAPRVPYEFWLLPRYHHASYEGDVLRSPLVREAAGLLRRSLARLVRLTEAFHLVLHTIPNTTARLTQDAKWVTLHDDYHWHFEVLPLVPKRVKSYSIKEVYFCPLSPERAAALLREAPSTAAPRDAQPDIR